MGRVVQNGFAFDSGHNTFSWIEVRDYSAEGWNTMGAKSRALLYCRQLEEGQVLFFRRPPFAFPNTDRDRLLNLSPGNSRLHKNVSYRPETDLLRGFKGASSDRLRIHEILRNYSTQVAAFVSRFLSPYNGRLLRDYASFRPAEEEGRSLPLHKRNDLLHIDAFPSRPTRGGRILRIFTNIHPFRDRVWNVSGPFSSLANQYAAQAGLHQIKRAGLVRRLSPWLRAFGVPNRSPYDRFMLKFHDFLKESSHYQEHAQAWRLAFPPASTWLVFTDGVPHAVLSGQYALEQTFVVPMNALTSAEQSPLRILEKLAGEPLA